MTPYKKTKIEIDSLDLYPGDIVTLWGNSLEEYSDERQACQVEVRVNKYGHTEIFYNGKFPVMIDTFDHYYRMEEKEHP